MRDRRHAAVLGHGRSPVGAGPHSFTSTSTRGAAPCHRPHPAPADDLPTRGSPYGQGHGREGHHRPRHIALREPRHLPLQVTPVPASRGGPKVVPEAPGHRWGPLAGFGTAAGSAVASAPSCCQLLESSPLLNRPRPRRDEDVVRCGGIAGRCDSTPADRRCRRSCGPPARPASLAASQSQLNAGARARTAGRADRPAVPPHQPCQLRHPRRSRPATGGGPARSPAPQQPRGQGDTKPGSGDTRVTRHLESDTKSWNLQPTL